MTIFDIDIPYVPWETVDSSLPAAEGPAVVDVEDGIAETDEEVGHGQIA